jgi:hypothetical protein
VVAGFGVGIGSDLLRLGRGLWRLRAWARLARRWREQQLGRVRVGFGFGAGWEVNQLVGVGAVSKGEPGGFYIDHSGIMEHNDGQHSQVGGYRRSDRAVAPETRTRWLKTSEHDTP